MFERAGIPGKSHRLRHSFAVDLLQRGVSLENVSVLLGIKILKLRKSTTPLSHPVVEMHWSRLFVLLGKRFLDGDAQVT
jgi:site-specific recombinase XerD